MLKETVYTMQPIRQAARNLAPGHARQFKTRVEAERAGERALRFHVGAMVLRQTVEPEFDVWSDAEVVWSAGRVPS